MHLTRRQAALGAAGLALAGALPARAEVKDLRLIAPAAPGGGWDQTARAMQGALQASGVKGSVQVVNVPGAGGTIGLAQFATGAKGDAGQIMVAGLVMVGAILTNRSPVNLDMVTPLARLTSEWQALVVPVESPLKTAADLAAALKADPGKVTWGGGSAGGVDHITAGLVAKAAGVPPTKINYIAHSGGGEALASILSGKVTVGVSGVSEFEPQVKAGKLRFLAVTSPARIEGIDSPTLKEGGLDVEIGNWRGVFAPAGLSAAQKADVAGAVERMRASPAWNDALKARGWDDAYLAADEFGTFMKAENLRVTAVLKDIGLVK